MHQAYEGPDEMLFFLIIAIPRRFRLPKHDIGLGPNEAMVVIRVDQDNIK